jgi:2-polyprenyl-6-methoxyphenol hydroxylase-like FAD-dependent oxidoreductase
MRDRVQEYDVAIIGAGVAGASLGAVLARQGLRAALIDPRPPHQRDFRAEKLTPAQWERLGLLGLQAAARPALTEEPRVWVARRGRVIEKRASGNRNFRYPELVLALRSAARAGTGLDFFPERVAELTVGDDGQTIVLGDGRRLTARLAAIATGVGDALPRSLGFRRRLIFASHSLSAGFDIAPQGERRFAFPALTYFGEKPADRLAYLSLFPIGGAMRANLFLYRGPEDPWLATMLSTPEIALPRLMPGLNAVLGAFRVASPVAQRPADLFRMENCRRPGVVLIGDAFAAACPASGSGLDKVFSDVARLNAHLPGWLATPGIAAEKIAAFYADPQKIAVDAQSLKRSRDLREMTIHPGLPWRLRRDLGFIAQSARGKMREVLPLAEGAASIKRGFSSLNLTNS